VAFGSFATNLVAGDTNLSGDVFVHDRQTGETTRVSVNSAGTEGNGDSSYFIFGLPTSGAVYPPSISADGRFVAFVSEATNLAAGGGCAQCIYVHNSLGLFSDVQFSHFAYGFVMKIFDAGITGGCSAIPPKFCPDDTITRGQMAVFIEAALEHSPNTCVGRFADVSLDSPFCGFIERLSDDGITGGCGGNNFCPNDPVTRGQMAVFIEAALRNPANICTARFADVPGENSFCGFIERLADDGITGGCGPGLFCPDEPVTRAQMAVFLVAAPTPLNP
jgi:hypothetical protein